MFEFLQPLFLYGMIAGIIPFIIHLFAKNKAKILKFSSILYLQLAYKSKAKRLKLKHLLLMLLRILLIVLFALSISKPILKLFDRSPLFSSFDKNNIIIVWDTSFSLGYIEQGTSLFEKSKTVLNDLLDTFKRGDKITLLRTTSTNNIIAGPFSLDPENVKEKIEKEKILYGKSDISETLIFAYQLLKESKENKKNIFVLTDMQEYALNNILKKDVLKLIDQKIPLFFLDLKKEQSIDNSTLAATTVTVKNQEEGRLLTLNTTIQTTKTDDEKTNTSLSLFINRKKIKTQNITPEKQAYNFFYNAKLKNAIEGYFELSEDNLSLDNTRYFYVPAQTTTPILLVDGDFSDLDYRNETFFLKNALNPYEDDDKKNIFAPTVIAPETLDTHNISGYEIIVLANVAALEEKSIVLLDNYVNQGGILWIYFGNNINQENYNYKFKGEQRRYKGLLPGKLNDFAGDETNKEEFFFIDTTEKYNHKISMFLAEPNLGINKVKFYKCLNIELDKNDPNTNLIASFSNKIPAIIEKIYGEGKVFMFNFTCDSSWTNFPLKTSFLPFIYEFIYNSQKKSEDKNDYLIGEDIVLPQRLFKNAKNMEVILPSSKSELLSLASLKKENSIIYNTFDTPGLYKLKTDEGIIKEFAANIDPKESNVQKIDPGKLKDFFKNSSFHIITDFKNLKEEIKKFNEGIPLSHLLLIGILLLLLIENFLANKMR